MAAVPLLTILKIEVKILSQETYGPSGAEYVLRQIANHLKTKLRRLDSCTRSGSKLTLIMPKTSAEDGRRASQRITELLRKYMAKAGFETVAISIGVAALSGDTNNTDALFWSADKDLLRAKSHHNSFGTKRSLV